MTLIHTTTYDQTKKWFDSGRKYKPIGTKLTKAAEETVGFSRAARRAIAKHSGR